MSYNTRKMTHSFTRLISDAAGGDLPKCKSVFREWSGEIMWYDVHFHEWDLSLTIPMPQLPVLLQLDQRHVNFGPELHKEYAEAYIESHQVLAADALAHALYTYGIQSPESQDNLDFRFGPRLDEAIALAADWWFKLCSKEELNGE